MFYMSFIMFYMSYYVLHVILYILHDKFSFDFFFNFFKIDLTYKSKKSLTRRFIIHGRTSNEIAIY